MIEGSREQYLQAAIATGSAKVAIRRRAAESSDPRNDQGSETPGFPHQGVEISIGFADGAAVREVLPDRRCRDRFRSAVPRRARRHAVSSSIW